MTPERLRRYLTLAYPLPTREKGEVPDKGQGLMIADKFSDEMLDASLKRVLEKFSSTLHSPHSLNFVIGFAG